MFAQYTEQTHIAFFLFLLYFVRNLHFGLFLEIEVTAHVRVGSHVQFGDVYHVHQFGVLSDGLVHLLQIVPMYVIVPLHADSVDGNASFLHLLYHIIYIVALVGDDGVVVVVEKQGFGVGLAGKLEGLGNELVTAEFVQSRITIGVGTAVGNGLVHHIPAIDHVLVAVHHGVYVFPHALIENLLTNGVALVVGEHPVAELVMPYQAVAAHLYLVLTAEVGNAVCPFPCIDTLARMCAGGFHGILCRHAVELLADQCALHFVCHVAQVYCHAYVEILPIGFFQAFCLHSHDAAHQNGC